MKTLLCSLTLVLALPSAFTVAQPNLVIILADDLGYGDVSAYQGSGRAPG